MPKNTPSTEAPKPQSFTNIQLYHICEHCNKEFEIKLYFNSNNQTVKTKCNCTHCTKSNRLWLRLVINS